VVIGLIALLIAMLLPGLARSRAAARSVKCLAQMRTLGQWTDAYADDQREAMPRSQHSAFAANVMPWGYAFFEYATTRRYEQGDVGRNAVFNGIYSCPADRRTDRWSYGYNVWFELTHDETGGKTYSRRGRAPNPPGTVLFCELSNLTSADHAMAHFWRTLSTPHEVDARRHATSSTPCSPTGTPKPDPSSHCSTPKESRTRSIRKRPADPRLLFLAPHLLCPDRRSSS
jgi:type II secretory pathway pseudopilin PulG